MLKRSFLIVALLASACAAYEPTIDRAMMPAGRSYDQDLAECRAYADQVSTGGRTAGGTAVGAAFGAALGAIIGAFTGSAGTGAAIGASTGGLTGAASGASGAETDKRQIVANCLRGRGYSVLA